MEPLTRITLDSEVMGGKPCIRGMRVTVGTIVGLVATGKTVEGIRGTVYIINPKLYYIGE